MENILNNTGVVTGSCTSRLSELKKYKISDNFIDNYFENGSLSLDGVDYNVSSENSIVYYIGGIKYHDIINDDEIISNFSFISKGYDSPDFIKQEYIKIPEKETIVDNPKIESDLFIDRQEISVFENNYKLEHIRNLSQLNTFVSGKYFKIVSNI